MKLRTKLVVLVGFMAVCSAFAIPMAWHQMQGVGGVTAFDEWNTAGRRVALGGVSIWGQRVGYCYYWNDAGQLDPDRSGWFEGDDRLRPLPPEQVSRGASAMLVDADMFAIVRAESLFRSRRGRFALDPELFNDRSWSDATLRHNPRPVDPWGRPYEIAPTPGDAEVHVICRGRDGIVGGTGDDADRQLGWDETNGRYMLDDR